MRIDIENLTRSRLTLPRGISLNIEHTLDYAGTVLPPAALETGDSFVRAFFREGDRSAASIEDSFSLSGDLLEVSRVWTLRAEGVYRLSAGFFYEFLEVPELFVPAVMYLKNEMGKGAFPRGRGPWSFLESRTPLPSCSLLYAESGFFAVCVDPAADDRFLSSSSASIEGRGGRVSFSIPGNEWPFSYTGKHTLEKRQVSSDFIRVTKSELPLVHKRKFFCLVGGSGGGSCFSDYKRFLLSVPKLYARPVSPEAGWEEYALRKIRHLLSLVEPDTRGGNSSAENPSYLVMGRGNGSLQDVYNYTAGSFLVKSLEGALVLARAENIENDPRLSSAKADLASRFGREQAPSFFELAEGIGRFFLAGEGPLGVHRDCFDLSKRIWGGYLGISEDDGYRELVNARCNGEVMISYVRLYEEFAKRGKKVPEFIELPKRVARFYLNHQLPNGSFGRWWSMDGKPVSAVGTNGAHIVPFLISAAPYMEEGDRIREALSMAGEYYRSIVESGEFFGDTLDASSCDKEAGCVLLSMFLDLYEFDGNQLWFETAVKAADFVLSWIWQYDCVFPPASLLGSRDFRTLGMTSVSVAHHHLDFYGMSIAYDFFRLSELSKDDIYREQGRLMMNACGQLVASERDTLGRGLEAVGWQPEQINHTDWDYFDRPECRRGYFDIDIAWVTVLGLGAYQSIASRFPEILSHS